MGRFGLETVVRRRDTLLTNDLSAAETVMLDVEAGTYFGVRDVAKDIWDRLEEPTVVGSLIAALRDSYEVDEETCRADVDRFLTALDANGLLEVSADGASD